MIMIRGVDMPTCCADCFAYVDEGDFPYCRILKSDYWTYTFDEHKSRMPSCPMKEQERKPVKPEVERSGGGSTWWHVCGACKTAINPNDKYCHECGVSIDWGRGNA